jgi:calpain family cysteine protease
MPGVGLDPAQRRTDAYSNDGPTPPRAGAPPATPRTEREQANARYEQLVSGGSFGGVGWGSVDYDHCTSLDVQSPKLFVRQAEDVAAIDPQDIRQGALGDCYLLSALAGMAATAGGRDAIRTAIAENKDDKGAVVSYTVTFQARPTWWGGLSIGPVKVVVDGRSLACGHALARPDNAGVASETWPLVFEQAYAKLFGGYSAIGNRGVAAVAMTVLTGVPADRIRLGGVFNRYQGADLQADIAAGKLLVLGTRPGSEGPDAHGLFGSHAYLVTGTVVYKGKTCVALLNPWGKDQPEPVPLEELSKWFADVSVGSMK